MSKTPKEPKELGGITKEPQREYLRVKLTVDEKMAAAKSIATAVLQSNTLEAELEGIKKKFKTVFL